MGHLVSSGAQGVGPIIDVTTPAIDTTGASLIVVTYARATEAAASPPITDSKGNTWTASTAEQGNTNSTAFVRQFHAISPIVGTGHTFTFTLTVAGYPSIAVSAFSRAETSSPIDQTASGQDDTSPYNSPTTTTLAQPAEIVVGSFTSVAGETINLAVGGAYTAGFLGEGSLTQQSVGQEWNIVASTAGVQSHFTSTIDKSSSTQVATYKEASILWPWQFRGSEGSILVQ